MKLSALILDTLVAQNKDWTPKAHYPSSASFQHPSGEVVGPDMLSQYLKWTGVKPTNPPDGPAILKMKLGNGTHETLAKILSHSGVKCMSETSFRVKVSGLQYEVSGRTDFLIEDSDGNLEVDEAKSSSDSAMFGKEWGEGKFSINDLGPKDDHKLQVICYLNCIPGLKRGRFLYIARDTGRMLEYVMEKLPNDHYAIDGVGVHGLSWAGIVDRWAKLEAAVKSGVAPAPDYRAWINEKSGEVMKVKQIDGVKYKTHWRVLYDNYRDAIWRDPKNFKYSLNATGVVGADGGTNVG